MTLKQDVQQAYDRFKQLVAVSYRNNMHVVEFGPYLDGIAGGSIFKKIFSTALTKSDGDLPLLVKSIGAPNEALADSAIEFFARQHHFGGRTDFDTITLRIYDVPLPTELLSDDFNPQPDTFLYASDFFHAWMKAVTDKTRKNFLDDIAADVKISFLNTAQMLDDKRYFFELPFEGVATNIFPFLLPVSTADATSLRDDFITANFSSSLSPLDPFSNANDGLAIVAATQHNTTSSHVIGNYILESIYNFFMLKGHRLGSEYIAKASTTEAWQMGKGGKPQQPEETVPVRVHSDREMRSDDREQTGLSDRRYVEKELGNAIEITGRSQPMSGLPNITHQDTPTRPTSITDDRFVQSPVNTEKSHTNKELSDHLELVQGAIDSKRFIDQPLLQKTLELYRKLLGGANEGEVIAMLANIGAQASEASFIDKTKIKDVEHVRIEASEKLKESFKDSQTLDDFFRALREIFKKETDAFMQSEELSSFLTSLNSLDGLDVKAVSSSIANATELADVVKHLKKAETTLRSKLLAPGSSVNNDAYRVIKQMLEATDELTKRGGRLLDQTDPIKKAFVDREQFLAVKSVLEDKTTDRDNYGAILGMDAAPLMDVIKNGVILTLSLVPWVITTVGIAKSLANKYVNTGTERFTNLDVVTEVIMKTQPADVFLIPETILFSTKESVAEFISLWYRYAVQDAVSRAAQKRNNAFVDYDKNSKILGTVGVKGVDDSIAMAKMLKDNARVWRFGKVFPVAVRHQETGSDVEGADSVPVFDVTLRFYDFDTEFQGKTARDLLKKAV